MSRRSLRLSSWLVCVAVAGAWGLPSSGSAGEPRPAVPTSAPPARGASDYVDGIDALEAGDWKRAVASLTRALQADGDNADYLRARGVAYTLAENFPEDLADLQRALKLRPGDREARLWLAAAYRMSGDPGKGAQYFSIGGEVPAGYANLVYNEMATAYWSSRYRGGCVDRKTQQRVEVKEPVKTLFPEAAAQYAKRHRPTGPGPSQLVMARNVVASWARLGMAQAAAAAGRWDRSHQILNTGEGWPFGLPADLGAQLKALREQVAKARFQEQSDALKAYRQLTPRELRKRSLQQTIDFLEKQRADFQADLSKPNLSDSDRRHMTQSVQQLDREIAQRKQALERLEQAPDAGVRVPDPGGRFPRGQR